MKKYFMFLLMFFAFNHGYAIPLTSTSVVLKAENLINFKVAGNTTILSGLLIPFVPTDVVFYGTNITGALDYATTPIYTIGWNAPYTNLINFGFSTLSATGNSYTSNLDKLPEASYGKSPVIPAGTDIILNVTTPDTNSITNIQQLYIVGYYLY